MTNENSSGNDVIGDLDYRVMSAANDEETIFLVVGFRRFHFVLWLSWKEKKDFPHMLFFAKNTGETLVQNHIRREKNKRKFSLIPRAVRSDHQSSQCFEFIDIHFLPDHTIFSLLSRYDHKSTFSVQRILNPDMFWWKENSRYFSFEIVCQQSSSPPVTE